MRYLIALSFALILGACKAPSPRAPGTERCIWVSRYEYQTPKDIERIMEDCASAGFTSVMFQVRGNGTVFYSSTRELWSETHQFQHPGFDPLAVAVSAAHARGLGLHAWINLLPGWRGDPKGADPRQLVHSRPEWFIADADARPLALESNYYWLNPCLPDVRRYLVSICFEIAANYQVDGIHLDHCRFADPLEGPDPMPIDANTRALFSSARGGSPQTNPQAYALWKTESVTQLIAEIQASLASLPETPLLSVAVWRNPEQARQRFHQDWAAWSRARLVDAIFPMNYDTEQMRFEENLEAAMVAGSSVPLIFGIGAYLHEDPQQTLRQMDAAMDLGADGVSLLGYSKIFGTSLKQRVGAAAGFRRAVSGWRR